MVVFHRSPPAPDWLPYASGALQAVFDTAPQLDDVSCCKTYMEWMLILREFLREGGCIYLVEGSPTPGRVIPVRLARHAPPSPPETPEKGT